MFLLCQYMWILYIKAKYLKENVITRIIKVKARQWFMSYPTARVILGVKPRQRLQSMIRCQTC